MINFEKLKKMITKKEFSGVVTIKKEGVIIFDNASGFLERSNKVKMEKNTKFGIASGTKFFTALGILKLIEEDKLKLDDYAFNYIEKEFSTYDKKVTIKQLLTHTSGIPDYYDEDFIEDFDTFKLSVPWFELRKPSDYLNEMPHREMKFNPGEIFNYNNSGFIFLSVIIEKITGNYYEYIHKILANINIKNTGFYCLDALPNNTAIGYLNNDLNSYENNIYKLPIIGGGDGGIFTNTYDLLYIWEELIKGNIINIELVNEMISPQIYDSNNIYYGYGIWLKKENNSYIPYLIGSDPGVSFYSCYIPDKKISCNILSNTSDGVWGILSDIKKILKEL